MVFTVAAGALRTYAVSNHRLCPPPCRFRERARGPAGLAWGTRGGCPQAIRPV